MLRGKPTLRAVARRMSTESWSSAALVSTMSATALPSSPLASDRLTVLNIWRSFLLPTAMTVGSVAASVGSDGWQWWRKALQAVRLALLVTE